jgi:LacI family transcriptional regulator
MRKKKATMQDIADSLGISRVTVWKALNNQPGVSEDMRMQIINKGAQLGYAKLPKKNPLTQDIFEKTISVIVSRPESSVFWTSIIHRIAQEISAYHANLLYIYVPYSYTPDYKLPASLLNGTVHGAIIINVYDEKMLRLIDELDIPKVYLDTVTSVSPHTLHGDVLLLEGYESIRTITGSILDRGCTELGFVGDIDYALTNSERYKGFLAAHNERKLNVKQEYCLISNLGVENYYSSITQFLDNLNKMPHGFVCASDDVAYFIYRYLKEKGYRIPDDIALSGYDGCPEFKDAAGFITTVPVQRTLLGKRLAKQLMYRIETPEAPYELIYIKSPVRYGPSTDF